MNNNVGISYILSTCILSQFCLPDLPNTDTHIETLDRPEPAAVTGDHKYARNRSYVIGNETGLVKDTGFGALKSSLTLDNTHTYGKMSHFEPNAILRGAQLTVVGALRALKNPGLFTSEHYKQAALAVLAGIVIRVLLGIPVRIQDQSSQDSTD
jgi:hypothetical protein